MRYLLTMLLVLLLSAFGLHAQSIDFNNFTTLKSSGKVPDDFTTRASVKYEKDRDDVNGSSRREEKDMENFLLESNYQIEDMLYSGRIIFGDPITNYLNAIKDELLKNDSKLKKEIRVYTLLSNEVNAFTFDNGIVVVTTGLVAQAQDEAQLAYILCHEFVHFKEKHSITSYVENQRVERGAGVYGSLSNDEAEHMKFTYAKEQETEADETGLEMYKQTNYSYGSIEGVFDVLLYSYLPYDEVEFSKTFFNDVLYVLPNTLFADTLNAITAQDDYDDSKATHPNIKKRKETIMGLIPDRDTERKEFIVSEEQFRYAQKLARYQGCELYLIDTEYENALYQAYLLQQKDPENTYLKRVIAEALYGWAMYKSAGSTPDNHLNFKKVEGESQQVFYMFNKMNGKEMTILALREVWKLHKSDPNNPQYKIMSEHLGFALRNEHDTDYEDFFTAEKANTYLAEKAAKEAEETEKKVEETVVEETEDADDKKNDTKSSKYDKIKKEKAAQTIPDAKSPYWKFAFTEYLSDNAFKSLFKEEEEEEEEDDDNSMKRRRKEDEFALGVNQVVIVDPIYLSVDERDENPVEFVAAEQARSELKQKVEASAQQLDLDVDYLDRYQVREKDTEEFNDMALLRRWIHEKLSHMDEDVFMYTSTTDELQQLGKKYDTEYFAWMGIVSFTEPEENIGMKILYCIYWPIAPLIIYDIVTPDRSTFYFTIVANAETGKFEMQYYNANTMKDTNAAQTSNIHYILSQIKNK